MEKTDFHNILFCTDFSHNADFAFTYVIGFAEKQEHVQLTIYHVIPEPNAQFWKTYIYEIDQIDEKARHDIDEKIVSEYLPKIPGGLNYKVVI